MSDRSLLTSVSKNFGIILEEDQLTRLEMYLSLLKKWNMRFNLLGPSGIREVINWHIADCYPLLLEKNLTSGTLVDVGCGSGITGIVISIMKKDLFVSLVDIKEKKIQFLKEAKRVCDLDNIEILHNRIEDLTAVKKHQYYHAVSKATFSNNKWFKIGVSLVRNGGWVWSFLSKEQVDLRMHEQQYESNNILVKEYTLKNERNRVLLGVQRNEE